MKNVYGKLNQLCFITDDIQMSKESQESQPEGCLQAEGIYPGQHVSIFQIII